MACVDYVIEKNDFIDPERLGVTGGSYGGYMANWIITQTDRFKAAVPVESISNLISQWGIDAVLAIYPNEGHGVRKKDHVIDYHRRILTWFDKYLK